MQRNMAAAREAATAVGNQDSGSTPAPAKGSGPAIDQVRDRWPYIRSAIG